MSDSTDPTIMDWIFKGLAVVATFLGGVITLGGGYILRLSAGRIKAIEVRQTATETLARQNQLDIKDAGVAVLRLQNHITENFCNKADIQASLSRVHEKIEDGNDKTEKLNENMSNKIDQLRRDLQQDIRSAIGIAVHAEPPKG